MELAFSFGGSETAAGGLYKGMREDRPLIIVFPTIEDIQAVKSLRP